MYALGLVTQKRERSLKKSLRMIHRFSGSSQAAESQLASLQTQENDLQPFIQTVRASETDFRECLWRKCKG